MVIKPSLYVLISSHRVFRYECKYVLCCAFE